MTTHLRIQADSPQPLYQQIKAHILEQIHTNAWPAGHKIPSENRLVKDLGISRMTINRALRELQNEGFIARIAGVGSFVEQPQAQSNLIDVRNIADEIRARGHDHSSRLVYSGEVTARDEMAKRFETETGVPLFFIVLVHHENAVPVQLEERYVNPAVAPEFLKQDFSQTTPTEYLLKVTPVHELEHVVSAALPTPAQCDLLEIDATAPCLTLHRRSWSRGLVVTAAALVYPASRYQLRGRFEMSFGKNGET